MDVFQRTSIQLEFSHPFAEQNPTAQSGRPGGENLHALHAPAGRPFRRQGPDRAEGTALFLRNRPGGG
jgi:hypothetical protein